MRDVGFWPGDGIVVPVAIVAAGSALLWFTGRAGAVDPVDRLVSGKVSPARAIAGSVLAVIGVLALASSRGSLHVLPGATAALGLAAVGLLIVLGPYLGRLVSRLDEERSERIRSEERAAIAAHLHDSVLQTLALIQRTADDPRRMVMLARRQERELRALAVRHRRRAAVAPATLLATCEAMAAEVELDHELPVELVVVGDAPLDEAAGALAGAVREAAVNAAKHAGAERVAIYVEVDRTPIAAFVRDTGVGFEPERRRRPTAAGISDSIVGRVERRRRRPRRSRPPPGGGTEMGAAGAEEPDVSAAPLVRVFLVDDHALFRAGVRAELAASRRDRRRGGDGRGRVDGDPGDEPGRGAARRAPARRRRPGDHRGAPRRAARRRFLALSVSDAAEDVIAVIRAGARGYVTKTITRDELLDADRAGARRRRRLLAAPGRLRARRLRRRARGPGRHRARPADGTRAGGAALHRPRATPTRRSPRACTSR